MQTRSRSHASCTVESAAPLRTNAASRNRSRDAPDNSEQTNVPPPPTSHCRRRVYGPFGVWGIASIIVGQTTISLARLCPHPTEAPVLGVGVYTNFSVNFYLNYFARC